MARLVSRDCVIDIELRDDEIVTIGRSSTNAICLRAPGISKVHAKIEPCEEGFRLCDLDSTNGTLVNGQPIKEVILRDRDRVRFGTEELLFLVDGKDLTASQVLEIFESGERPPERAKDDGEFLWGDDERTIAHVERDAGAAIEVGPLSRAAIAHSWRAPGKKEEGPGEEEIEMDLAEGEFALVGEVRPVEDIRGEFLRLERQLRFRRALISILWLTASALLHLQVVLLIKNVSLMSPSPPPRRIVVLNTRFLEPMERETLPPLLPKLTEPAVLLPPTVEPEKAAAEKIQAATKEVIPLPVHDVPRVEIEGLFGAPRSPTPVLTPSVLGKGPGTGQVLALVTPEKPQTQAEILDDLVREMVEVLRKEFLHVILLFDESRSVDRHREWMRNRLEGIIAELFRHLKPREVERLRWSVASFGRSPHLQQTPTQKLDDVRKGILRVPNDDSGIENPCQALQFCMRNLRTRFTTFIIMFTDERGDDTSNDNILEATIADLRRFHMRVFVFGREAAFGVQTVKEPYRDPRTGQVMAVDTEGGPESAMCEFFTPDELFYRAPGVLNADRPAVSSGFGLYALSYICNATKGRYYFLNPDKQSYDPARMEQYAPDLCSRKEYMDKRARFVVRQKILTIVQEWDKVRPESRVQTTNVMTMVPYYMNKVDKAISFCTEGINALKNIQFKKTLEPHNMRWEAHRDLVLAELYKFKYLLEEYKVGFKGLQGVPLTRNGGPLNGFVAMLAPGGGGSSPAARKLYETTIAQFKVVLEKHAGTPWATIASEEMKNLGRIIVQPTYMPPAEERREERQPPQRPPEPPKV